jgi:hypothetical protein
MFQITQDPSSGSIDSYLIKTTRSGSTVLVVCAVVVWRHIQDLWCVCALRRFESYCNINVWFILQFYITQILISTTSIFECISGLIKVTDNNDARWKLEINLNYI